MKTPPWAVSEDEQRQRQHDAAPEMYDALRDIVLRLNSRRNVTPHCRLANRARAALNKAREGTDA